MNKIDLSAFFTTKPQAVDFSARLSDISSKLYETDLELETLIQQHLGVRKKDDFFTLLRDNQIPLDSNSKINEFIKTIKETISEMPEATLTLAVDPDEETLKAVTDWFLLNIGHQVLIDIRIDPDIIAGAEINYKGNHFKSTLKPLFEKDKQVPKHETSEAGTQNSQTEPAAQANTDQTNNKNITNEQAVSDTKTNSDSHEPKPAQTGEPVPNESESKMNGEHQFRVI